MKDFVKYHFHDSFVLTKKRLQLKLWENQPPIIVHTMAKVGSLSVYNSLIREMPKTAIFHTHSLNPELALAEKDYCFKNNIYPGSRSAVFLINEEILRKKKPHKIISLFRDPIERNISAFFDAFELYVGIRPELYNGSLENLEKLFHEHLPFKYPLEWFDQYFFEDTKIDIYSHDFDQEAGSIILRQDVKDVLIINSHLNDELKRELIGDFCELSNFKLVNTNLTNESAHKDLYLSFKNFIRFDKDYLEGCYNSKYAQHFFTKSDRESAFEKWLKSK